MYHNGSGLKYIKLTPEKEELLHIAVLELAYFLTIKSAVWFIYFEISLLTSMFFPCCKDFFLQFLVHLSGFISSCCYIGFTFHG